MMRWFICAVMFSGLLSGNAHAELVKNISTGIDDVTGLKIANDTSDTDYIIGVGSVAQVGVVPIARSAPLPNPYIADATSPNSRWLAIGSGDGQEGLNVVKGTYFLETSVDLSGFDFASAQITGLRYAADDIMQSVFINGVLAFTRPNVPGGDFFSFQDIGSLGLGMFQNGINSIRFEVPNIPDPPTVMALRIEGAVEANAAVQTVPEPASIVLSFSALSALLLLGKRQQLFR